MNSLPFHPLVIHASEEQCESENKLLRGSLSQVHRELLFIFIVHLFLTF